MSDGHEYKSSPVLEVKQVTEDGEFEGYASLFGVMDSGRDIIERGAFAESLKANPSPKMLWQHNISEPIGKWLSVTEDAKGLKVRGKVLDSIARGREILTMMREGIIEGMSIGYVTVQSERDEQTGIRKLKEVDLLEISLVTFPALNSAKIDTVKGRLTKTDISRILRGAGVPSGFAKKLIAGGYDLASAHPDIPRKEGVSDTGIAAILKKAAAHIKEA